MFALFSLALIFVGVAIAAEYKSENVHFKLDSHESKAMKNPDTRDHYKVEAGDGTDRQIASQTGIEGEEEPSDRFPSSVAAKKKKEMEEPIHEEENAKAPQPWLYRNKSTQP